jgi:hypothetical protein
LNSAAGRPDYTHISHKTQLLFFSVFIKQQQTTTNNNNKHSFPESTVDFRLSTNLLTDIRNSLRLSSKFSTNNMHCWVEGRIVRFDDVLDLLKTFVAARLPYYEKRLEHQKMVLHTKLGDRKTRIEFLQLILNGSVNVLTNAEQTIRQGVCVCVCVCALSSSF